jgi:hypothetical protein
VVAHEVEDVGVRGHARAGTDGRDGASRGGIGERGCRYEVTGAVHRMNERGPECVSGTGHVDVLDG